MADPAAAEGFEVAWRTAMKWADCYRDEGPSGMFDRSPLPRHQPNGTPPSVVRQIVRLRRRRPSGPVEIGDAPGMAPRAVLVRCRLNLPEDDGWRYVGRQQGDRYRAATPARTGVPKSKYRQPQRHQPRTG